MESTQPPLVEAVPEGSPEPRYRQPDDTIKGDFQVILTNVKGDVHRGSKCLRRVSVVVCTLVRWYVHVRVSSNTLDRDGPADYH